MSGFDWKSLVSSVAPLLGTAVGGPFGLIAGQVLQKTLGVDSEEAAIKELKTNPDALLKLKQGEQDFAAKMKELDISESQLHADDRDSARNMQIQTKSWIVPALSVITVAAFFGVVFWVLSGKVTLESTLLGFILGQVSSKAEQVYNYFFGSSKGSSDKTAMMAEKK
jgi:hypothetical protein